MSIFEMKEKFVYTKGDNYKILICSVKKKYYIQMNGKNTSKKEYDTSSLAIEAAKNAKV